MFIRYLGANSIELNWTYLWVNMNRPAQKFSWEHTPPPAPPHLNASQQGFKFAPVICIWEVCSVCIRNSSYHQCNQFIETLVPQRKTICSPISMFTIYLYRIKQSISTNVNIHLKREQNNLFVLQWYLFPPPRSSGLSVFKLWCTFFCCHTIYSY